MARYPVLEEPFAPDWVTLDEYGDEVNRSPDYIRFHWRNRDGFPGPVGQLPPRGRNGGGRGQLVYSRQALNDFRAQHQDMWPEQHRPISTSLHPDRLVTLGFFADRVAHVARKTVTQARDSEGFPAPVSADSGLFRLGDLVDYWNTRPGRGLRRQKVSSAAA